jgi:hypothetical protein
VFGDAPSQNATKALVLSILTAVCAALVATAADAPSGVRLLLLIVGAAIPPLVLHIGPRQGLRAVVALAITGVALFVAYGGFAIFAFASHRPSALPLPPSLPNPSDGRTETRTQTSTTPSGSNIDVSPDTVHCDIAGCDHTVTITSTGDEVLKITTIEFDPDSGEFAQHGTCERHDLMKHDQCEVDVTFVPSSAGAAGTHYAQMVINQELSSESGHVALEGKVEEQPTTPLEFDLDLVGPVPFADRYQADVSINGTSYSYGFCGFTKTTRCEAGKHYTWTVPSVGVGAKLSWHFTRGSLSTDTIAQGASTLAQATTIAVKCIYSPTTGNPVCMRIK